MSLTRYKFGPMWCECMMMMMMMPCLDYCQVCSLCFFSVTGSIEISLLMECMPEE